MIEVENVVPSTPEDNHGASPLGQLMGLPVALQIVDAFGLFQFVVVVIASEVAVACALHVALMQMIVSVPVPGIVIRRGAERDKIEDDGDTVAFAAAVTFQSLHPDDSVSHAQDVVVTAPLVAAVLFDQYAEDDAEAVLDVLVEEEVMFALVAGSPDMTEEVGEEETGDPEVLESSIVLLNVSP